MKLPSKSRPILNKEEAAAKLRSIGQEHLLYQWDTLSKEEREALLRQLNSLEGELFLKQRQVIRSATKADKHPLLSPFTSAYPAGNQEDKAKGFELIKEGKAAVLVLSGGQGSRLRFKGPKGFFEITPYKHKSLFQLVAEKVLAASKQAKRPLEMAFMTSPLNHFETQTFFAEHAFFGLNAAQITFFYQGMWPFLDFAGDLFFAQRDQIAKGPNGNGCIFRRLVESGIWDKWNEMGIEMVHVIPIDNPLAHPFQQELFGFHARLQSDISLISAAKKDANENVGVLATLNGKTTIVEYTEMSDEDKSEKLSNGELKFGNGNMGIYVFSMPFIKKMSHESLPLHAAKKSVQKMEPDGQFYTPQEPNAWKFEEFIFDSLPFAERVNALTFSRDKCFAPLKNLKGEDSMETVRAALLAFDREIFAQISEREPPSDAKCELAPQFHYPTAELLEKWKGKPLPNEGYIHD